MELNSSYYSVESSIDGNHFIETARLESKNNANGAVYNFTVNNIVSGINYFRIKAVDLDGKLTYTQVLSLSSNCNGNGLSVKVLPNPTANVVNVQGVTTGSTINIYAENGQRITSVTAKGTNQQINLGKFAKGIYILGILGTDGNTSNIKVIRK